MPDADRNFVTNLTAARRARGWTQAVLADELSQVHGEPFNQSAISRIEKGERPVRLGEARAIAEVFETTVDELSGPPEAFAPVIERNRRLGDFASALIELITAAKRYEKLRVEMVGYFKRAGVPERTKALEVGEARSIHPGELVQFDAIEVARSAILPLRARLKHGEHPEAP